MMNLITYGWRLFTAAGRFSLGNNFVTFAVRTGLLILLSTAISLECWASTTELHFFNHPRPLSLEPHKSLLAEGQPLAKKRLEATWTLVAFGYASCHDVCPLMLSSLKMWLSRQTPDVRGRFSLIFVNIDNRSPTRTRLESFLAGWKIGIPVHAVIADAVTTRRMAQVFYPQPIATREALPHGAKPSSLPHASSVFVIGPDLRVLGELRPLRTNEKNTGSPTLPQLLASQEVPKIKRK